MRTVYAMLTLTDDAVPTPLTDTEIYRAIKGLDLGIAGLSVTSVRLGASKKATLNGRASKAEKIRMLTEARVGLQCAATRQGQRCTLAAGHRGYHSEGNEAW